jgi:hypothetical protein
MMPTNDEDLAVAAAQVSKEVAQQVSHHCATAEAAKQFATQQPFEFDEFGVRLLRPLVPVRFEDGLFIVTLDGIEHEFAHPVGAVLSRIIDGDRFSAAEVTRDFYTLQLADFVNVFASTDHVLAALEFGRTPDELMAAKLNGMAMAARWHDAGQRARYVRNFCKTIGRCGFAPAEVQP